MLVSVMSISAPATFQFTTTPRDAPRVAKRLWTFSPSAPTMRLRPLAKTYTLHHKAGALIVHQVAALFLRLSDVLVRLLSPIAPSRSAGLLGEIYKQLQLNTLLASLVESFDQIGLRAGDGLWSIEVLTEPS